MLFTLLACATRPGLIIPVPPTPQERLASADETFSSRDYSGALVQYQALVADEDLPDQVKVEALAQTARCHSLTAGGLEAGQPYLDQALALASESEPLGWTRTQGVLGIYQREAGEPEQALQTFSEAYVYALERELPLRAIDMAHHAAIVAPGEQQIDWAEKGIAAAEAAGSVAWLAVLYNNLGAAHEEAGDPDQALTAYRIARDHRAELEDPLGLLIADWAVAHAERLVGEPAARTHLEAVLERAQDRYLAEPTPQNAEWVGYPLEDLAELTAAEGDTEQALVLLREARARYVEAGLGEHWPEKLEAVDMRLQEWESLPPR